MVPDAGPGSRRRGRGGADDQVKGIGQSECV